jgi:uncharacterized cofD-like protein
MKPKVVVMGGGTGTFPVVSGLKHEPVDISCIIAVSDSGGSTGRIRDEFGFQPVGDLRQALAALAVSEGEEWIRKLLLYRFEKGDGLQGHNLGNLILTALQDMCGDTYQALQLTEKIFRLNGQVIPVTQQNVQLEIEYTDGQKVVGEHILDETQAQAKKIAKIYLTPDAVVHPEARKAIENAQLIIIAPGDYYASVMATLVPQGVTEAFASSRAKIVYMSNLMTRFTQTHEMSVADHVKGIEAAIGKPVDHIVVNTQSIPQFILAAYAEEKEFPVVDDMNNDSRVIRAELLSDQVFEKNAHDTAHRSLLRHDSEKIRKVLSSLV